MVIVKGPATAPTALTADEKIALQVAAAIVGMPIATEAASAATLLRVNRNQAAKFLCALGYEISANKLAKLAVHGDGPQYRKWGRRVVYCPMKLLEWARAREGAIRSHTSEAALLEAA